MYRRSISIITAASLAALAGQAMAQQQLTQSEARQLSQKLEQSDKSLVDAIQLAERETGGKALAASLMTDRAVEEIYRRQGAGQTDRPTERDMERESDRDMPRPGQDAEERQREMEERERDLEERQRELEREGERNLDRQQENRDRLTGGQQRGLHAEVTCLVDGQQLRKVVVNLEESRVVDSSSIGGGEGRQPGDISAGSATQMRLASSVINANAVNAQGDDIGDISDLALDVTSGQVRYAVLRAGGFLGMGGDHHAVPLSALTFVGEDEVRINVTEEQMEQREGFDTDRWPQRPSPAWGGQPGQQQPGQDRQPEVQRPGQTGQEQMSSTVEKASDVIGATVHGAGDASVGDVDDIVIKTSDSSIAHYVIATDDGKVAVPADKIKMENRRLTLDMEATEFEQLPRFGDNENPDWTNPQWLRDNEERRELDPQRPSRGG